MPGVSVTNTAAGAEGSEQAIIVRGRNSITADNSPLIILDGIPFSGSYSDINPMEIESLEILKDASAAAIYGSRGSNGVILITSKRGKAGKALIRYNGLFGVMQIANIPEMLTGPEFYEFKTHREPDELSPSEIEIYNSGEWVNWIDEATRMGQKHQHTLSASGGSENTRYYISGTYLNVKGIAKNDDFSRYSTSVNIDSDLTSWLTLGSNTKLSLIDRAGLPASFSGAFHLNPLI
jgi:TonB-dependent SusC/RagA subfamily outer membrane receptor